MNSRQTLESFLVELDPQRFVGKTFKLTSYGITRSFTIRGIKDGVVEAVQDGLGLTFPLDEFETALTEKVVTPTYGQVESVGSMQPGEKVWYRDGKRHHLATVEDFDTIDNLYLLSFKVADSFIDPLGLLRMTKRTVHVVATPSQVSPSPH